MFLQEGFQITRQRSTVVSGIIDGFLKILLFRAALRLLSLLRSLILCFG